MSRIIIDVREPLEYNMGHVKGAINIPPRKIMSGLPTELADVPKDTELVLYCVSGSRSNASMHYLRQYGFTNLINGINKHQVEAHFGA
jgi:phage shock protein E